MLLKRSRITREQHLTWTHAFLSLEYAQIRKKLLRFDCPYGRGTQKATKVDDRLCEKAYGVCTKRASGKLLWTILWVDGRPQTDVAFDELQHFLEDSREKVRFLQKALGEK